MSCGAPTALRTVKRKRFSRGGLRYLLANDRASWLSAS
jgi:hypothetical protein